jgi:hypothetical protein
MPAYPSDYRGLVDEFQQVVAKKQGPKYHVTLPATPASTGSGTPSFTMTEDEGSSVDGFDKVSVAAFNSYSS